MKEERNLPLA